MTLAEIEKHAILETLEKNHWHQGRAAEALDISERTIRNKIRLYRQQGDRIPSYYPTKSEKRAQTAAVNSAEIAKRIIEQGDFDKRETLPSARSGICPRCNDAPSQGSHAYCLGCHAAYMREWREDHPLTEEQRHKEGARSIANTYQQRGRLEEQPCLVCGAKAEKHHEDYSKPLEVVWLCRKHHLQHHRTFRKPTEKQLQKAKMEQRKRQTFPGQTA